MVNIPNIQYLQYLWPPSVRSGKSHERYRDKPKVLATIPSALLVQRRRGRNRPPALGIGRRATGQRVSAIDRYLGPLSRTPPLGLHREIVGNHTYWMPADRLFACYHVDASGPHPVVQDADRRVDPGLDQRAAVPV